MNLKMTAISGMKWTTIGTIGRSLFQILQISILTRYLPKEAFGLLAMSLFVVQFSYIFVDMGMTSAILHRQNATKDEYSSIYWLNILISIILYAILYFSAPFVASFYNESELTILIPIIGINLLIMASGRQHSTMLQKQFQFKTIAIIELYSYFLGLVTAILLAIYNFGVYSLVYSTILASFVSNTLFLIKNLKLNPIRFHLKLSEAKPFLKVGGYTMGSSLLDFFSRETDILIIGKVLNATQLGIYSLSKQIVIKLFLILNPIVVNVLSPLLSSIQNEKERLKSSYLKVVKYLAYLNFPIYILVIATSKEILHVLYGEEYATAYPVLSFLAIAYCFTSLSNPVGSLQIATGRTDIGFKWTILRVLITPAFIFIGSLISIEAVAAFYALLSLLFIIPLWYIQLRPMAQIHFLEYLKQFYKPLVIFLAITLIIYYLGNSTQLIDNIIMNAIFKSIITLFVFIAFILASDKKAIFEFMHSLLTFQKKNN